MIVIRLGINGVLVVIVWESWFKMLGRIVWIGEGMIRGGMVMVGMVIFEVVKFEGLIVRLMSVGIFIVLIMGRLVEMLLMERVRLGVGEMMILGS